MKDDNIQNIIQKYDYSLPSNLVAVEPAIPRDSARLFIYNTKNNQIFFDIFANISNYLPDNSLTVFNDTRVLPVRLIAKDIQDKEREILVLINEKSSPNTFKALVKGKTSIGDEFFVSKERFVVKEKDEKVVTFETKFDNDEMEDFILKYGITPLPPYIKGNKMSEDDLRIRYQSIFSSSGRSAAAPTASLHFTRDVFDKLHKKGIQEAFLTLDVGLGTFASLDAQNFIYKRLHSEYVEISKETSEKISRSKSKSLPIIAVGTTSVRSLESFYEDILNNNGVSNSTDLFILPGYKFNIVDHLITNFHVPKSSLLILVDSFLKHKKAKKGVIELYKTAIENNFRFFSFGDSMLII